MTPDVSRATDARLLFMRMEILAALEDAAAGGGEPTSSSTEFATASIAAGIVPADLDANIRDLIPGHTVSNLTDKRYVGDAGVRVRRIVRNRSKRFHIDRSVNPDELFRRKTGDL